MERHGSRGVSGRRADDGQPHDASWARDVLDAPSQVVAPLLLGSVLHSVVGGRHVAVRLTEVEAYEGAADPASHAYRGRTARNAIMFGPAGFLYVYFVYGMHWCANVVCGPDGDASAVLLRAGAVVIGRETAAERRPAARSERDLARGPARLAQALGLTRADNGTDLLDPDATVRLTLADPAAAAWEVGPRVGVAVARDAALRFWLPAEPTVSVYRPGGRATPARARQTQRP